MEIAPAALADCHAVAKIHVEAWQHAYEGILPSDYLASLTVADREVLWRRLVGRDPSCFLVARRRGQIIGFVAAGPCRDEDAPCNRAEIWAIYVKPAQWSTGVGRQLWLSASQQLRADGYRSVSLWVIANNTRAIGFYVRSGFVAEPGSHKRFELARTTIVEARYVYYFPG